MTKPLRITLAQLNLLVGDIAGNLDKHLLAIEQAENTASHIIVFSELSLTGYSPEDLLLRKDFLHESENALNILINKLKNKNIYCLVGHPHHAESGLYNACSLLYQGTIITQCHKQYLPNYGVFDEKRYFKSGNNTCVTKIHGVPVGIIICEDVWHTSPIQQAKANGAELMLIPNASPFEQNKHERRLTILSRQAKAHHLPCAYINQIGGQDDILFDGGSMVVNAEGILAVSAGFFKETLLTMDFHPTTQLITPIGEYTSEAACEKASRHKAQLIYDALVLAVRDYLHKNHFQGVYIGVSGGIDSALTVAIALDALGKDNVRAVLMPSRYTTAISTDDSLELIKNANIHHTIISIEQTYQALLESLMPHFEDKTPDVTEENMQARCRAIILMALANKHNYLVLTTGNRSELAVGYCTLYGDMAGGYAILKDIPKTLVYELAYYRNQCSPLIPERTLQRAPTAELKPDQKDEDTLPPYPILDDILARYLNHGESITTIVSKGFDRETVLKVMNLIRKNEYKRHQSPPGPHINHKAFNRDWRYPITNGFKR